MELARLKKTISAENFTRIKPYNGWEYQEITECARMLLVEGLTLREIARQQKVGLGTVNNRIVKFMLWTGGLEIDNTLNDWGSYLRYTPVYLG